MRFCLSGLHHKLNDVAEMQTAYFVLGKQSETLRLLFALLTINTCRCTLIKMIRA